MMAILITGATGFLGRELYYFLKGKGFLVYGTSTTKQLDTSLFQVDITGRDDLEKLPREIDVVIHLAAVREQFDSDSKNYKKCMEVNAIGSLNVARFAAERGIGHFVYISSNTVYGSNKVKIKETVPANPNSNYGVSKYTGEMYCKEVCGESGMKLTILRLANVFGGSQKKFLIAYLVDCVRNNKSLKIFGRGEGMWDLVYLKDVLEVILKVVKDKIYGTYNIGSGKLISVKEIAETVLEVFNESESKIIFDVEKKENKDNLLMDISKAKRKLGYEVKYYIEKGLEDYKRECSSELMC